MLKRFLCALAIVLTAWPAAVVAQPGRRATVTLVQDVIYGRVDGAALLADIGYPSGGTPLPAIIYVHGGRWRGGSRTSHESLDVAQWAASGFFAMTIDHRLVGSTPAPAPYQDLQCAIRWVHAHADEYGIDPDRIYLLGDSSGGHLVALAATLGEGPFEPTGGWDDARSDIRAAISVSGPYDLDTLSWGDLWTPMEGNVEDARRLASPIRQIATDTKPILVIHSDDDRSVPIQQAIDMAGALDAAGVEHRLVHYADRGHMQLTDEVIAETQKFIADLDGQPVPAPPQQSRQPTAATDVTRADIQAVFESPDGGIDRQIKVVDIGDVNLAVGVLHRQTTTTDGDAVRGLIHNQVTEVYYIVSGEGILMTGGTLQDPEPRARDSDSVRVLVGPSVAGTANDGNSRRVSAGDVVIIPAGVFHGWRTIDDHVTYLSIRPDLDRVLPAGYVNPAIAR